MSFQKRINMPIKWMELTKSGIMRVTEDLLINYTNFSLGDYMFNVKGSNNDGNRNQEGQV